MSDRCPVLKTADNEKEHPRCGQGAERHRRHRRHLAAAAEARTTSGPIVRGFAKTAEEEGFPELAAKSVWWRHRKAPRGAYLHC